MGKNRAIKARQVQTVRELAKLLNRPFQTVGGWVKHPDWIFERIGPWSIDSKNLMLEWAVAHLKPSSPIRDSITPELRRDKLVEEVHKTRTQNALAETALARARGELISTAEVEREWKNIGSVMRAAIQDMGPSAVSLALQCGMPMTSTADFAQKFNDLISDTLSHLASNAAAPEREEGGESILVEPGAEGEVDAESVGREGSAVSEQGGVKRAGAMA